MNPAPGRSTPSTGLLKNGAWKTAFAARAGTRDGFPLTASTAPGRGWRLAISLVAGCLSPISRGPTALLSLLY